MSIGACRGGGGEVSVRPLKNIKIHFFIWGGGGPFFSISFYLHWGAFTPYGGPSFGLTPRPLLQKFPWALMPVSFDWKGCDYCRIHVDSLCTACVQLIAKLYSTCQMQYPSYNDHEQNV